MPATKTNKLARVLVPVGVVLVAIIGIVIINLPGGGQTTPPTANNQSAPAADEQADAQDQSRTGEPESEPAPAASAPGSEPSAPTGADDPQPAVADRSGDQTPEPTPPAAAESDDPDTPGALAGLRARPQPTTESAALAPIGSLDPASGYLSQLTFTPLGAGVDSITLTNHFETASDKINAKGQTGVTAGHYRIQALDRATIRLPVQGADGRIAFQDTSVQVVSLAARAVLINGQLVDVFSALGTPVWREESPGAFVCEIEDGRGELVATIRRSFVLTQGSNEIRVEQTFENATDEPLEIEWVQYGPSDLSPDFAGYRLDTRRVRIGHLVDAANDPSRQFVDDSDKLLDRRSILSSRIPKANDLDRQVQSRQLDASLWPDVSRFKQADDLVWVAQTSRHFVFAVHPLLREIGTNPNTGEPQYDKSFELGAEVYGIALYGPDDQSVMDDRLLLQTISRPIEVPAGGSVDLSFGAYAGPKSLDTLSAGRDPIYEILGLDMLVVFNIGSMCALCTFQWLAQGLFALMRFYESLTGDWAISIILLVLTVRILLHPIYRKSQISIMRFGKQMQRVAPKQKKIQEKYKDDPKRMQQEMVKLMREENVNYAGALGCLPMFLQMPVWIALYAMLYFAFDIRHEPAFYGVIQQLTGDAWLFLADLSAPDRFIPLPAVMPDFEIPFLFGARIAWGEGGYLHLPLMGEIRSINVLPVLMAVLFWFHQKFLTPQTQATLSPEQEQQQKLIRVLVIFMSPIFLFNAPSGLAIYFITNSALAIIEGRWVRAHVDAMDLNAPPKKKGQQAKLLDRAKARKAINPSPGASKRDSTGPRYKRRK